MRDDFGGHCLARTGGSGEQRANPAALGKLSPEPPVNKDAVAMHNLVAELSQLLSLVEGKHEVVPMVMWFNLDGQLREFVVGLFATGGVELSACHLRFVARHRPPLCDRCGGVMNLPWRQTELTGKFAGPGLSTT